MCGLLRLSALATLAGLSATHVKEMSMFSALTQLSRKPVSARTRPPVSAAARCACETLENRLMFVTYQVTGTSAADSISISISGNSIISVVNGISDSASDIINNNIQIDAMGGNDTISIIETGANTVVVNASDGND